MTEEILTATECTKRMQLWGFAMVRGLKRARLKKLIEEKDTLGIFQYCIHRAADKQALEHSTEALVYGVAVTTVTEAEARILYTRAVLWTSRIWRWWGLK